MIVPHIRTPLPGPRAKALIDRDAIVVSPSYTRSYPLVIERGSGAIVEDVDGNVFLDCTAGIAVNSTGHSHPDVVKAILEQAPIAVRLVLEAVETGLDLTVDEALLLEANHFGLLSSTADMREGTAAFLARRKAEFKGR